jgi:hypothetical protein
MLRSYPALFLGATLFGLGGCATTTLTSTWKAPNEQTMHPTGKTVAAVFVSGDEHNRHVAEDALAKDLNLRGAHGVAGYTLLPNDRHGDAEVMLTRLKEAGANEVVVMRVVGEHERPLVQKIIAPSAATGGGNAPNRYVGRYENSITPQFTTLVWVETLVYSLNSDEILWSSTSRTVNPKDIESLVNEVANATAKEMVRQGLLARQ